MGSSVEKGFVKSTNGITGHCCLSIAAYGLASKLEEIVIVLPRSLRLTLGLPALAERHFGACRLLQRHSHKLGIRFPVILHDQPLMLRDGRYGPVLIPDRWLY